MTEPQQKENTNTMKTANEIQVGDTVILGGKPRQVEEVVATSWRTWLYVGRIVDGNRIPYELQPDELVETQ